MHDGFVKVAAATPEVKVADVAYNVEQICRQIDEASEAGAKIIVFPELCITGYSCGDLFLQQTLLDAAEEGLIAVIRFTGGLVRKSPEKEGELIPADPVVFVGLPMELDGKLYNVAAAIQSGRLLALIPKQYIPEYADHHEGRYFTPGNAAPVPVEIGGDVVPFGTRVVIDATASVEGLMIGCEICEDAWVPDGPARALASVGVTMMVNLSASAQTLGKADYRRLLLQSASARLICSYVYTSAGCGESTSETVFSGHRMICENGVVLAESDPFANGLTISEIDIQRLRNSRRRMSVFLSVPFADDSYHRAIVAFTPEETSLTRCFDRDLFVPCDEKERDARCAEVLQIQSLGLKKRMEHTGCRHALIGLSGGLDSALALIATATAFDIAGKRRKDIICVTMPCFGTSDRTYQNARTLAEVFGATLKEIDIKASVTTHLHEIGHPGGQQDVTYENAQARERTQVLMDMANAMNGLVIGTGDLSELALGWCTYNGDQMSMYGVNAGVPKTLVRHVVRYYADSYAQEKGKGVLYDILDTPPSPELLPAKNGEIVQRTEDAVGPYELHDFFLNYMLRLSFTPRKIFRLAKKQFAGTYDEETIKRWLCVFYKRFFAQQFKRAALPEGVSIGSVTLSPRSGFTMPSDVCGKLWIEEAEEL